MLDLLTLVRALLWVIAAAVGLHAVYLITRPAQAARET
jgi:hypothetical protein